MVKPVTLAHHHTSLPRKTVTLKHSTMTLTLISLGCFIGVNQSANASSFQLLEQSPAHLGTAFAGTASDINDASVVFFNPAAMTQLKGSNLALGANIIATQADFSDHGSNTGGGDGKTEETAVIPNIYFTQSLNDRWSIGFGVNAPYGLASVYEDDWTGRYLATESELEVVNINGVVAFAVTEQLSLGAGISYQRAEVTLKNQVDSSLGLAPSPATDSSVKVQGDDDDVVFDLSLLWQPNTNTNIGISWRQGGEFTLSGETEFSRNSLCSPGAGFPTGAPPAPTTGTLCSLTLNNLQGDSQSKFHLPDTFTLSSSYMVNEHWAIHGDFAFTEWSNIDVVTVTNSQNSATVAELDLKYDNTKRFSLGTTYKNQDWTWRAGIAFDEAPQTDPQLNSPRVPDGDRTWLSVGFNYAISEALTLDVAYAHLFVDDVKISSVDTQTGHFVNGSFNSSVDIIGAQLNWNF